MPAGDQQGPRPDLTPSLVVRLRRTVTEWEARLVPMSAAVPAVAPPPSLWPKVAARIAPKAAAGGREFPTAESFSQYLIAEHSICTVPWDDAGPFLRFSVTYEAADEAAEDALMAETQQRLEQIGPEF